MQPTKNTQTTVWMNLTVRSLLGAEPSDEATIPDTQNTIPYLCEDPIRLPLIRRIIPSRMP